MQESPNVERRVAARIAVERPVILRTERAAFEAVTVNVSTSGMLLALAGELAIWADVEVDLPGVGLRTARVARRDGERFGLVFREPLLADEFEALTGIDVAVPESAEPAPVPKRAGRTAPWAFGRDRLKTLKREAAERAQATMPPRA